MRRSWQILGACCYALAAGAALPPAVPVFNAGFEQEQDGRPAGWTLATPSGAALALGVGHVQGFRSLRLENPAAGAESTVVSEPLKLKVGQLYRLSAFIRAKGVHPDPTARYPTALGACVSMKSFPFTNASPTVAGDGSGQVSVTFFATASEDRVQLHLGRNGRTPGVAWFDGVTLEQVDDLKAIIPMETVRWAGPAFRYEEGGWIYVHIEGEPYERGRQYGELVSAELARFVDKLAILQDKADPAKGWDRLRGLADALMEPELTREAVEVHKRTGKTPLELEAECWRLRRALAAVGTSISLNRML